MPVPFRHSGSVTSIRPKVVYQYSFFDPLAASPAPLGLRLHASPPRAPPTPSAPHDPSAAVLRSRGVPLHPLFHSRPPHPLPPLTGFPHRHAGADDDSGARTTL